MHNTHNTGNETNVIFKLMYCIDKDKNSVVAIIYQFEYHSCFCQIHFYQEILMLI